MIGGDKRQVVVNLKECQDFRCNKCGGVYFSILYRVKIISALVSPTGQDELFPVRVLVCAKCGEVFDIFNLMKSNELDG